MEGWKTSSKWVICGSMLIFQGVASESVSESNRKSKLLISMKQSKDTWQYPGVWQAQWRHSEQLGLGPAALVGKAMGLHHVAAGGWVPIVWRDRVYL